MTTLITDSTPKAKLAELVELLRYTGNDVPRWLDGLAQGPVVEVEVL